MKKITLLICFALYSYVSFSQCIESVEYPVTPTESDNSGFEQEIAFNNEAGEYATIYNLIIGHDYQFTSTRTATLNNDFITITDESDNWIAYGISPLTVNSISLSTIRMHISLDAACTNEAEFRVTTIQDLTNAPTCYKPESPGISYNSDTRIDFYWNPPSMSTPVDYDWEIVPEGNDQGVGVIASGSTGGATNASTGDVLSPSTFYSIYIRSNCGIDGYSIYLGPLTPKYPTNSVPPPSNDFCGGAVTLIEETSIPDAASATPTAGSLLGGAGTDVSAEVCGSDPDPGNARDDVWYKFIAKTTDVHITVEPNPSFDVVVTLYSGDCNALSYLACSDVYNSSLLAEEIYYTGLTIGQTYYTRAYYYGTIKPATLTFGLKVWSSTPATDADNDGYVASIDCDDNDPEEFPGQTWYIGVDSDGDTFFGSTSSVLSCENPGGYSTTPPATPDCDDDDIDEYPGQTWHLDSDGDGYGEGTSTVVCERPTNYYTSGELVQTSGDCDDSLSGVNPGATEIEGNGLDDDCNPSTPDMPLGIDDFDLNTIRVVPNPFNEKITIYLPSGYGNDKFDTYIYDINGRTILKLPSESRNSTFVLKNLNALQKGLYFVKISSKSDGKSIVRELVKY